MKLFTVLITMSFLAIPGLPQGAGPVEPAVEDTLAQAIDAIHARDPSWLDDRLAEDIVWVDENGHRIAGEMRVRGFIGNTLMRPGWDLKVSDIAYTESGDTAWASFEYTVEGPVSGPSHGTSSVVLMKSDTGWQVAMVHAPRNAPGSS